MSGTTTEYVRAWRAANPDKVAQQRRQGKIRDRAMVLLARVHPVDYAALAAAVEADMAAEEAK